LGDVRRFRSADASRPWLRAPSGELRQVQRMRLIEAATPAERAFYFIAVIQSASIPAKAYVSAGWRSMGSRGGAIRASAHVGSAVFRLLLEARNFRWRLLDNRSLCVDSDHCTNSRDALFLLEQLGVDLEPAQLSRQLIGSAVSKPPERTTCRTFVSARRVIEEPRPHGKTHSRYRRASDAARAARLDPGEDGA